jgi:hypothetical protein
MSASIGPADDTVSPESRAGGSPLPQSLGQSPQSLNSEPPCAFALHPFAPTSAGPGLRLEGWVALHGRRLHITYQLCGDLPSVVLPPPTTDPPERADGLWQHTCFELFLAAEGKRPYWEVNLSPDGSWNLYRLDDYRQGLTPVPDRDVLPFTVISRADRLELSLDLLLPQELALACLQHALQLGVTAVIEHQGGALTYWALAHSGPEADFHRREDFLLRP